MEKWERIINELDKATEENVQGLINAMPNVSKVFYDNLIDLVSQLKLRTGSSRPKAAEMAENLKKLTRIYNKLNSSLMDSVYKDEVGKFIVSFDSTKAAINKYYTAIMGNFDPSKDLFLAIKKANVSTTVDSLLVSGVNANFIDPVKKVLQNVVTGNGDMKLLKAQLSDLLLGSEKFEPRLKAYVSQVSSDSVRQFQRNYILAVSEDLGLKHYFYKGTETADTRHFCHVRHGHYYTETEVKGWASLTWQGKARGTNEVTIFTYCGGYHCKHTILPVSETIYKAKVNEG
jgi:hypothetical protein